MTPAEFEREVARLLRASGIGLSEFTVQTLETVSGTDGDYVIDATARFEALGVSFLVLVECKHHKNPIKREVVQVLRDKMAAVGAQKGMVVSTVGFQRGAVEYARTHGIALLEIVDGMINCLVKSREADEYRPDWIDQYVAQLVDLDGKGYLTTRTFYQAADLLDAWQAHYSE